MFSYPKQDFNLMTEYEPSSYLIRQEQLMFKAH